MNVTMTHLLKPPNSHCAINMMFIYKIMEVKICVSLRECHGVSFAENEAVTYMSCLEPNRKLILTAILINFSQTKILK